MDKELRILLNTAGIVNWFKEHPKPEPQHYEGLGSLFGRTTYTAAA